MTVTYTGLGQDGYILAKKETTFGTPATSSMTALPINAGSLIKSKNEWIENDNLISSRIKQVPSAGRTIINGQIILHIPPTLLGMLLNLFLGTSANGTVSDSTYVHTWLLPTSGDRIGKSFTIQQAIGGDLADQFAGCVITKVKIACDSKGKIKMTCDVIGSSLVQGASRVSPLSYPTKTEYNFAFAALTIGGAAQLMNNFEIDIDLGYDTERFKLGSVNMQNPLFKTNPSVTFKCNIDAEKAWLNASRAFTSYALVLSITSVEYAAGTTPFLTEIEIPAAILVADTTIPNDNDHINMDLSFNCGFGGTTTGSSSAVVMAEVRHKDATATYA